jgi:non-specific protein-tyrosine kinase
VNPDINQLLVSQSLSSTYASVATKRPILDAVIKDLSLGIPPETLAEHVQAEAAQDSTLLTIATEDADPARAAAIANAVATELVADSPAIQGREVDTQAFVDAQLKATQAEIESTQAQVTALTALPSLTAGQQTSLDALQTRLASLRSTLATLLSVSSSDASNLLTIIEPAVAPTQPISPNRLQNTLLAAALALLLVAGVIAIAELLYDGIRDADAVTEATGLTTIGTIAQMKTNRNGREMYLLAGLLYPRSSTAEAYRTLRTNIEFSSVDGPIKTLLVTSSVPGEGKTVTASNLAVVFAQTGRRVLLVDADLRKPGVHAMFNMTNEHGLTTLLRSGNASVDAIAQPTEQENLRVLTTGPLPPNPAELVGSQRMRKVVELMTAKDLVIIDSPPLQAVTDAAVLSSFADATLLVIDAKRSRRRVVRIAGSSLDKAGANVLGVVLNRVPVRALAEKGAYGGYYMSEE